MQFGIGQIRQIGLAAFGREEDVALSPEDDRLRLPLAQECLPLQIQRDNGAANKDKAKTEPYWNAAELT